VQTYMNNWPLLVILMCSIGLYLMSVRRSAKGLWARTSTARFVGRARRAVLAFIGRPEIVRSSGLPSNVHNYRIDASTRQKRVVIYPE